MKIFDLFSGVGGFRLAAMLNGFDSAGFSEIDKHAIKFYNNVFGGEKNYGDATKISGNELPKFEILCAGFPCQSFSIAGKRRGFDDVRGTRFFDVARILKDKRPRYFVLENVKGLLSHDDGKTFQKILEILTDIGGYTVEWALLNSRFFGVPQNRERVFIVGYPRSYGIGKIFPLERKNGENISANPKADIVYWKNSKEKWIEETKEYTGTLRTQSDLCRQTLIKPGTIRSFKDGAGLRRLTPLECFRLQGWPGELFMKGASGISDAQLYKLAGNSVTVTVVSEIMKAIKNRKDEK